MRIIKVFIFPVITVVILFLSFILWPNTANAAGIELSASQGKVGSTITIKGNGFSGKVATIYWDKRLMFENVPISEQGNLQYDLVIPLASKGFHTIHIEDDSNWAASTASINFTVLPDIRIYPEVGNELTQVTITGSGFDSKEEGIGLIWDGNTQIAVNLIADSHGTWNTLFTVPNVTTGEHYFSASGSTTKADELEEITFIVTPWARVEPTSGSTGTKIKIFLWGFQTSESGIKLIWDEETIKYNLTANTKGDLLVTVNTPECAAGNHLIQIQRKVTTKKGNFPDMYFKVTPNITLQPTTNKTRTSLKLTGTGFAKKEPLTISLDKTIVNRDLSTDNKGSFSAVLQIPETEMTEHIITVQDRSGNSDQDNFATKKTAPLTTPQLIAPKEGYKIVMVNSIPDAFLKGTKYVLSKDIDTPPITFVWSKLVIGDGINYILEIAADNDFSAPILNKRITTESEYTLSEDGILSPGNYGWRVKAISSTGLESSWSQVYEIEITFITTQVIIMSSVVMVLAIALIALGIWRTFIIIAWRRKYY